MSWIQKTTQWLYATITIDDLEVYEIFEPNEEYWLVHKNIHKWIIDNYISVINDITDISYKFDLIEFELPNASEE